MFKNRLGWSDPRLFSPVDGGGGDPGGGSPNGGGGDPTPSPEPTVYEVDDNTLIKPKGLDKPVRYADHVKGFQTQYTKAAQDRARIEKELATERGNRERYQRELETLRQQSQQGGQGKGDVYGALRELPYLTGAHAVEVVESIGQELQRRDQIMLAAVKELQAMKQMVHGLHQTSTNSQFETKMSKFLSDADLGPEYAEFAKELYVAYEGDDLDQEFPRILTERVASLEKAFASKREKKIAAARQAPFIPGKGASVGPNKPLEIKPNASSKDIANLLFPLMGGTET